MTGAAAAPSREPSAAGAPAATVLWSALALALAHFGVLLLTERAGVDLPFVRAALACLALPAAGLPLALAVLAPRQRQVGGFVLLALSFGCALVLHFVVCVAVRLIAPPVSGTHLALTSIAALGVGLVAGGRGLRTRIAAEPGLSLPVLGLAALIAVAVAVCAGPRLFGGLERFIIARGDRLAAMGPHGKVGVERRVLGAISREGSGVLRPQRRRIVLQLRNTRDHVVTSRIVLVLVAPLGVSARLEALASCDPGAPPRRTVDRTRVPAGVLDAPLEPVTTRFNTLLGGPVRLRPGPSCFAVTLGRLASDIELVDVSDDPLGGWLGDERFRIASPGTTECHLTDARYRLEMRRSNRVDPNMLLWGYFTQFVAELLSGSRDPMLGILFMVLALFDLAAAMVLMGAARSPVPGPTVAPHGPRRHLPALLLLAPYTAHLLSMVYSGSGCYAFPDAPYTFLVLGALAALVRRQRVAIVTLGSLAAFARYPGAYVVAAALLCALLFVREHRRWTSRTILWGVGAGIAVAAALLLYFGTTIGISRFLEAIYFEVFPEHFKVMTDAIPVWHRIGIFFAKLAILSGFSILLWPLSRGGWGKTLIATTMAYAATLMAVHIPHSHYYPILIYCTAAAGIGALASRPRPAYAWIGVTLTGLAGVALSRDVDRLVDWLATL